MGTLQAQPYDGGGGTVGVPVGRDAVADRKPGTAKLLVVSSAKGGGCKTTTARNLAVIAAHCKLRVATVDLDAQGTLSIWHRLRPPGAPRIEHRVIDIKGSAKPIQAVVKNGGFDLVVVDTPPGIENHAGDVRAIIKQADFVVIPSQPLNSDINSNVDWARSVRRDGTRFAFLLSRTFRNRTAFGEAKQRLIEAGPLCAFDIRDAASVNNSDKAGLGNYEIRGDAVGQDFLGAWSDVARQLGFVVEEV
jgi:chromosome partitioning protein